MFCRINRISPFSRRNGNHQRAFNDDENEHKKG